VELTALLSRSGMFLNFYVSRGSIQRGFKRRQKYYIYFVDNSLLLTKVKEYSNWLTFDEVITKIRYHVFSETQCI